MAIIPKLEIRQSQSLLMTPQLRQAINLLQLSNLELNDLIDQELENNPLLEKEELETNVAENLDTSEEEFQADFNIDEQFDDSGYDQTEYGQIDSNSWEAYNLSKSKRNEEDYNFIEERISSTETLQDKIEQQIRIKFKKKQDCFVALYLSQFLDGAGYFRGDLQQISERLKTSKQYIEKILKQTKEFEPTGIFAQNLSECLQLQLQEKKIFNKKYAVLLQNLDIVAEKKYKTLAKLCQCSETEIINLIKNIKELNPKPTANYNIASPQYIIPDVFVKQDKYGQYYVELNNSSLPHLIINMEYAQNIQNKSKEKQVKSFIKEKIKSAQFLTKSLHQRASSILIVSGEIVKAQYEFFEKGINYLKPLSLKDIAERTEMHESTISRVTTNKYMHTPIGIFELKYFFSQAGTTFDGETQTSTTSIKHLLKKLIDEESPKEILSDDKLVEEMAKRGIQIARRTITKYREALKIPSSSQRKREKRNSLT